MGSRLHLQVPDYLLGSSSSFPRSTGSAGWVVGGGGLTRPISFTVHGLSTLSANVGLKLMLREVPTINNDLARGCQLVGWCSSLSRWFNMAVIMVVHQRSPVQVRAWSIFLFHLWP